jgi:hypothetical protein
VTSRTAEIRAVARTDRIRAEAMLSDLIADLFGIPVTGLAIRMDAYSLNSLNGFFASDGQDYFFKFHQEEGEEAMRGEYYRADILARAGLPVDQPLFLSSLPGEQLLVYRRRSDPRLSDVLFALDRAEAPDKVEVARVLAAEAHLNDAALTCARATLAPMTPEQSATEPIHRLFHDRLTDPGTGRFPGGRLARFYVGKRFVFPGGLSLDWDDLASARPVINGVAYERSLGDLFERAHARLAPARLADAGGIVAHGDAHNANVWMVPEETRTGDDARLVYFDPAFAGTAVPALLAEVKSTFHNIFAHPFWLYTPELAQARFQARVRRQAGQLIIETDWHLNAVRRGLLDVKVRHFWGPWLATLAEQSLLPADWEDVIRLALFLCPTLVMSLRAGDGAETHNPVSSAIGLSVALAAGSRPIDGRDMFTDMFQRLRSGMG